MPLPKLLPAEDAAICQPLPASTFSHPVLSRKEAHTTRASHECMMGPPAIERALERMKREPPPAPMPAMKIRQIKARVFPKQTHGGDADFEDSQLVAHALPDVYCRGFTGVVGGFGSYAIHPHGLVPYVGVGGGGGPVIPARVIQRLPPEDALDGRQARRVADDGFAPLQQCFFDLQGQALKIMERAKILEQKNRFQEYQASAIAAAVAFEATTAAGVAAPAPAPVVGPTKRKNGSGGSSNSSDSGGAAAAAGPARRGGSDGGGHGSDGDYSEQSSLGVGSDISALSLGSGSAASSGSMGSASKKARVDKKGAAAAAAAAAPEPGVKRRRTKIPLSSVELLQDWFTAHVAHPYPTEEEKLDIMERAKLDSTQLVNWFTNTRKRFWYQHPTDRSLNRLCATRVSEGGAGPDLPPSCKSTGAGVSKKKSAASKRRSTRVKLEDESDEEETDDDDSEAVAAASSPKTSSSRSNKKRSAKDDME